MPKLPWEKTDDLLDELVPQSNHYHIGLISYISVLEMIVTRVVLGKHH